MKTVLDDEFYTIDEGENFFVMTWKEATGGMNDEQFVAQASKFLDLLKEKQHKNIIVDMKELNFAPSAESLEWRNQNLIAYYNEIGVEKFAFVASPEQNVVSQDNPENTFVTQVFQSLDDALEWVNEV